jgi:L-amino acid N-acyltransferase YncA
MRNRIRFANPSDFTKCKVFDSRITPSQFSNKANAREILLAFVDEKIVGYLRLEFIWLKIPYVSWIFVSEKYRKQGVASRLVKFLGSSLKRKQFKFILSSYQDNAPQSKRWHAKIGFRKCGKIQEINEDNSSEVFCQLKI